MTTTYFIQAGQGGPIKIGRTNRSAGALKRLKEFARGNPVELKLVGTIAGDLEAKLKEPFKPLRLNGEWFQAGIELVQYIIENASDCDEEYLKPQSLRPSPELAESVSTTGWMTPPAIAKMLGKDVDTVYGWIRRGDLEAINMASHPSGKRWLISPEAWEAFCTARRNQAPPPRKVRERAPNINETYFPEHHFARYPGFRKECLRQSRITKEMNGFIYFKLPNGASFTLRESKLSPDDLKLLHGKRRKKMYFYDYG